MTNIIENLTAFLPIIVFIIVLYIFFKRLQKRQQPLIDQNLAVQRERNELLRELNASVKSLAEKIDSAGKRN